MKYSHIPNNGTVLNNSTGCKHAKKTNKSTSSNNHTGWKNAENRVKVHGLHKSTS